MPATPADLFERHHRALYRYLLKMTSSREQAEDLTQEVFVRVMRARDAYKEQNSERAYEDGMIVRRAIEIAGGIRSPGSSSRLLIKRMVDGRLQTVDATLESAVLAGDQVFVGAQPTQD